MREIKSGARNVITLIVHITHFYYYKSIGTELIVIGWKIVPNEEHVQCNHRFASQPLANEPLHSSQLFDTVFRKRAAQLHYVGPELRYIFPKEARKCSAAQGPRSEVVLRAF